MIPYGKHKIHKSDILEIKKVLNSDFITQGPKTKDFQNAISKFSNSKYCVVSNSASSSLIIACKAIGLNKNDNVWTVPNSYVATANCALHCGAKIDFVDIDINTGNISIEKLEQKLKIALKNNTLPKLIITVHFAGSPTDQELIFDLSKKYKFKIIEDCSHSFGAKRNNFKIGDCRFSDISVFSFHPVKMITTGEGGACTTNNIKYYNKLNMLNSNGITKNIKDFKYKANSSKFYYEQQYLGFNFRMSDIQAALGLSQIKNLSKTVKKRNHLASLYKEKLSSLPVNTQYISKKNLSSYHIYVIRIIPKFFKLNHKEIFNYFHSKNILINLHYLPIHLHPFYRKLGFKRNTFVNSEMHAKTALTLPLFYDLEEKQINYIVKLLSNICK